MKRSRPGVPWRWAGSGDGGEGRAEGARACEVWWSVGGRIGRPAWDSLDSVGSSKRTAGRLYRKGRGTAVVVNLGKGRGWPMCVLGLPGR